MGNVRYLVKNAQSEEGFLRETFRHNVIKIHLSRAIQNILHIFTTIVLDKTLIEHRKLGWPDRKSALRDFSGLRSLRKPLPRKTILTLPPSTES